MKKCPFCAEEIQDDAIKCKHCGEWLNKASEEHSLNDNETSSTQKEQVFILPEKKSKGYLGLILLFILYANIMMRKPEIEYVTRLSYFLSTILELGGAVLLFFTYRSMRNWLNQKAWLGTKKWIASLIAGIISLLVITNIILIIQTIFYSNR
jgi:hypothetical protein